MIDKGNRKNIKCRNCGNWMKKEEEDKENGICQITGEIKKYYHKCSDNFFWKDTEDENQCRQQEQEICIRAEEIKKRADEHRRREEKNRAEMMLTEEVEKTKKEGFADLVMEKNGTCKFCGQMMAIEALISHNIYDCNEIATELCTCDPAQHYQWKKRQKTRAIRRIYQLFSTKAQEKEVEPYMPERCVDIMIQSVDMLQGNLIEEIKLKGSNGVMAEAKITQKGIIRVKKSRKIESVYQE